MILLSAGRGIEGLIQRSFSRAAGLLRAESIALSPAAADAKDDAEWRNARPFEEVPGPKPAPIFGNVWRFLPFIGEFSNFDMLDMHRKLYKRYGKVFCIRSLPGNMNLLFVCDPQLIEKAFRNEGVWPLRSLLKSLEHYRNVTRKDFFQGLGGLLVVDGKEWHDFRTKVNQPMLQPKTVRLYVKPINDVSEEFIQRVFEMRDAKMEMPPTFRNEIAKWALESIAVVALDVRLGCLEPNLKPDSEPQKMIRAVNTFFECATQLELGFPFWRVFPTPTWKKYTSAQDYMIEYCTKHINKAVERLKAKPEDSDEDMSLLERLISRDPTTKTACIMAMDTLSAGIDTTSLSVAHVLYQLSKHPDKQQKLHEEVRRILPPGKKEITSEDLEQLPYLRACIKESARLTPVFPGNNRTAPKDMVLGGYRIPKGTVILMPNFMLSNEDEFFAQASKFIPERWLKTRKNQSSQSPGEECPFSSKPNPFVSLPFGFGPRMCIGRRFAELEIEVVLAKMIQNFQIEYHYGEMEYSSKILCTPKKPLQFTLLDRK